MEYKVLVIEDEKPIQRAIVSFLKREGYYIDYSNDGAEGLQLALNNDYHLILLDMCLPTLTGEEILIELRKVKDTPVMIISALQDELIQLESYQKKIDDYIVKPFSMNILICKISALFQRIYPNQQTVLQSEDVKLFVNNYEVYKGDQLLDFTVKEFEILKTLLRHKNRVFTRDELYTSIWGYDACGDTRTIDVHIGKIRRKTNLNSILTVSGVGYKVDK